MFFKRNLDEKIEKAIKRSPVVLLTGARQTGKTTLIQKMLCDHNGFSYQSFDDLSLLSAAKSNPIGFIENIKKPAVIDEVQRIPEIFLPIKSYVDKNRQPGIFVLTGSANPLLIPKLSDSLAGRMEVLELYPLSVGELFNKKETFLNKIFSNQISFIKTSAFSREELYKRLVMGGYPSIQGKNKEDAYAWFNSYIATILQRDVQELSKIEGLAQLPNLLHLLSTRTSSLFNVAELARASGISTTTLHRYITLLKVLFLVSFLEPWNKNLSKRFVKSPKVYLLDTGILLHLLRADENLLALDSKIIGKVFENFVISELTKQASWNNNLINIYHYRTQNGVEVDALLEDSSGNIVGIEIKSGETLTSDDFKNLKTVQNEIGSRFVVGIVLYLGNQKIPFAKDQWAIPVSALWE